MPNQSTESKCVCYELLTRKSIHKIEYILLIRRTEFC